ncbi:pentapeptide repeat-containing protein [Streptomyces avicenniae]|uniref:pentapeptide repeat-containing protein n=1 Tax=Streptomyces avicenniae TaxID=500153 RepID=UPI00069B71A8|nr:pentapeptide repeat-containing protein [Streptomyces avicenniae]
MSRQSPETANRPSDARAALRADCGSCFGLCCVALPFTASADFPVSKDAGRPCGNLTDSFHCGIHDRLRETGYTGCTVYDCFGAGQRVSQMTFGGRDWRAEPGAARAMFDAFAVTRQLHELLWYLTEAVALPPARPLRAELRQTLAETRRLAEGDAASLARVDVPALRARVGDLLARASALVRATVPGRTKDRRGADLMGARLRGAALRGATLRGTLLVAADLRKADLRAADLLGADLRNADLRGADLTDALFVTQPQLTAARGDAATRFPSHLTRPAHWTAA